MSLIETVAALAILYALLSIVASACKELLEAAVQKRKNDMKGAIEDLLGLAGANAFFTDARIQVVNAMTNSTNALNKRNWPSYIEPATFAAVAQSILASQPHSKLARAVSGIQATAAQQASVVQMLYEQRMERLIGSFKRNAQWVLLIIGFFLAVAVDADTLRIAKTMATDTAARSAMVAMASQAKDAEALSRLCDKKPSSSAPVVPESAASSPVPVLNLANCLQDKAPSVLGWTDKRQAEVMCFGLPLLFALVGYLLTAIAISLGAPFWFDLISKVSNIRATYKSK